MKQKCEGSYFSDIFTVYLHVVVQSPEFRKVLAEELRRMSERWRMKRGETQNVS